jgi:hypothetical protein
MNFLKRNMTGTPYIFGAAGPVVTLKPPIKRSTQQPQKSEIKKGMFNQNHKTTNFKTPIQKTSSTFQQFPSSVLVAPNAFPWSIERAAGRSGNVQPGISTVCMLHFSICA